MPDRASIAIAVVAAAIAAVACAASVQFGTPIDRALPFLAVVVVALSLVRPSIAVAVPLLIVVENTMADEPTRLLAIGVVMAAAFAFASVSDGRTGALACSKSAEQARAPVPPRDMFIALLAVLVLRWIPLHDVVIWRELIILAGAVAVAVVMNGTTLAVVLALFAPAWPIKVAIVLFVVAFGAAFALRRVKNPLSPAVLAIVIAFFPWSGVMARGWTAFIRPPWQGARHELRYALKPGTSMTIDVPEHASALIVSGANMQRLPCSTVAGWMNGRPIHATDWGFMRREQFFVAKNCYPRDPAGRIRDYGWSSWIDGADRVLLPPRATSIRIDVNPQLPPTALLQIEAFE